MNYLNYSSLSTGTCIIPLTPCKSLDVRCIYSGYIDGKLTDVLDNKTQYTISECQRENIIS